MRLWLVWKKSYAPVALLCKDNGGVANAAAGRARAYSANTMADSVVVRVDIAMTAAVVRYVAKFIYIFIQQTALYLTLLRFIAMRRGYADADFIARHPQWRGSQ